MGSAPRYGRFALLEDQGTSSEPFWGQAVAGDTVQPLVGAPWEASASAAGAPRARATLRQLAPADPSKIVCVGRNYASHAAELGHAVPTEPLLFLKPPSALVGPGAAIELPPGVGEVHHEGELALVIGKKVGPGCTEAAALEACFALTCANDVTARALQKREGKFTRAKGFDTFCALGPWAVSGEDPLADRRVRCRVNGETRQDGQTASMVFGARALVAFIASVMTLLPGDLILTGTPPGVGPLVAGDVVAVEVEGLGVLENPVIKRPTRG